MSEEIVHLTQSGPYWDWQVALDLFLGGAGVGALLFAILIDVGLGGKYRRLCHTAAWLSPILVATGLVLIMIKMGRPFQAYHTYLNVNLTSPLWWGGIFQPLVVVGGFIYAYLWNQPDEHTIGLTNTQIEDLARAAGVSEAAILKIRDGEFTRWVAQAT